MYLLESTVAQAILDFFVLIFVHIRTTENIAITRVIAVHNTAVMSMDAYANLVNIIIRKYNHEVNCFIIIY